MSIKDNYMGRVLAMLPADPSALEKSLLEAYHNPIQAELAGLNKYAILTKLQELNANKQAKANQQAQGQAQMPTVAEQILAEASPDMGGVASIPFDENLFQAASGGIVSFAEGGDVQGYSDGEEVKRKRNRFLNADDLRQLTAGPDFTLYPYDESARYLHPELSEETMRLVLPQMPVVGDYPQLKKPVKKPDWYTQGVPKADVADWYVQRPTEKPIMGKEVMPQAAPKAPIDAILTKQNAADLRAKYGDTILQPKVLQPKVPAATASVSQSLVTPKMEYVPMVETDMTPAGNSRAAMDEYKALIGEDPYATKAAERINQMTEANELYKKQFPWMALAEAGFAAAAGKSPFALDRKSVV